MKFILVPVDDYFEMYDETGKMLGTRRTVHECRFYLACLAGTKIEVEVRKYAAA